MKTSSHLQTVHRGSRFLAWSCLAVAIIWPLISVGYVMMGNEAELFSTFGVPPPVGATVVLKAGQRLVISALNVIPILAAGIGLWALSRCFRLFSAGEFFSVRTVGSLRRFSGWTFCYTALSLIFQPLTMLAVTFRFPEGQHLALISFGPQQLHALLLAGTVWVISGTMAEAGRLADENAQFV
jgi:hypothetical protein